MHEMPLLYDSRKGQTQTHRPGMKYAALPAYGLSTAPACEMFSRHRLTRLGTAELEARASDRRATKVVLETDHAMDFGAREIQRIGYLRRGLLGQIPESLLQRTQHRQGRSVEVPVSVDDFCSLEDIPRHSVSPRTCRRRGLPRRCRCCMQRASPANPAWS